MRDDPPGRRIINQLVRIVSYGIDRRNVIEIYAKQRTFHFTDPIRIVVVTYVVAFEPCLRTIMSQHSTLIPSVGKHILITVWSAWSFL
jgi:hypothetical protein